MRKPECGRQSSVAEDENARVQCAIAAVTEKPLGEVLAALVEEEPDVQRAPCVPVCDPKVSHTQQEDEVPSCRCWHT